MRIGRTFTTKSLGRHLAAQSNTLAWGWSLGRFSIIVERPNATIPARLAEPVYVNLDDILPR